MGKQGIPPGGRLAAFDIGTNSILLTVAGRGPGGRLSPVHDSARVTRLGAGLRRSGGILSEESIRRSLTLLQELRIEAGAHDVAGVVAAGTEVLRAAKNAASFLGPAAEILGGPITVLTGEREARLSWLGVSGGRYPSRPTALLDVGGGSTEYVRATGRGVLQAQTMPLGAVTLLEASMDSDGEETAIFMSGAAEALVAAGLVPHPRDRLVASGGTATTLSAVLHGVKTFDPKRIEGSRIGMADILGLINRLWSLERDGRSRIPGMDPERVDTIVPGAVILATAMKLLDARELSVTTRGLRHGLLIEAFGMSKAE